MTELDLSTAYDGMSKRRSRRALQPLERDILCRIITDILGELRRSAMRAGRLTEKGYTIVQDDLDKLLFIGGERGIRMDLDEVNILVSIRNAINPRPDGG